MLRTRALAGLLASLTLAPLAAPAAANHLNRKQCQDLRNQWYAKRRDIEVLKATIEREARGQVAQNSNEIREALQQAAEVMGAGDASKVKDQLDRMKFLLTDQKSKLAEFLQGTSEGLDKSKALFDKAKKALEAIDATLLAMEDTSGDPAGALQGFANHMNALNTLLGPLIGKVPGLGDFMKFYTKALDAITGAVRNIIRARVSQEYAALGTTSMDPRWSQVEDMEKELRALERTIRGHCGSFFRFRDGGLIEREEADRRDAADRAAAAAAAAAAAERRRVAQVQSECRRMLTQLQDLRTQIASINRRLATLRDRASVDRSGTSVENDVTQARALKRQAYEKKREAERLEREIREKCGRDDPETTRAARDTYYEITDGAITASSSAAHVTAAAEAGTEKREVLACIDRCKQCLDELARLRGELDALTNQVGPLDGQIANAEQAVRDAEAEVDRLKDRAKVHVYEDSRGNMVLSAVGGEQGGSLSYKGWVIPPAGIRQVRAARAQVAAAQAALAGLRAQRQQLQRDIEAKRRAVADKEAECRRCREECKEKRDAFLRDWARVLVRLGDDGKVQTEGAALERSGDAATRAASTSLDRATRTRATARSGGSSAVAGAGSSATGSLATHLAPGKTSQQLTRAADALSPHDGGVLFGPFGFLRIDVAALRRLAAGEGLDRDDDESETGSRPSGFDVDDDETEVGVRPSGFDRDDDETETGSRPSGFDRDDDETETGSRPGGFDRDDDETETGSRPGGFDRDDDETETGSRPGGFDRDDDETETGSRPGGFDRDDDETETGSRPSGFDRDDDETETGSRPASGGGGVKITGGLAVSEFTRWERVKLVMATFFRAYVQGDVPTMMRMLSGDFLQDPGILQAAVRDDLNRDANIALNLEILEVRVSFMTILARVRWTRSATSQNGGLAQAPTTGVMLLRFSRLFGFLIQSFQGDSPMGLDQRLGWLDQMRSGQLSEGSSSLQGSNNQQTIQFTLTRTAGSDHALVNFSGGSSLITGSFGGVQPGFDAVIIANSILGYSIAEVHTGPFSANVLGNCNDNIFFPNIQSISDIKDGPAPSFPQSQPNFFQRRNYWALVDRNGNYVLMQIDVTPGPGYPGSAGSTAQVTITYQVFSGSGNTGIGQGTETCP